MPEFQFTSIDILDGRCCLKPWVSTALRRHPRLDSLANNARFRAENALALFCGIAYLGQPYFACNTYDLLPWAHEYLMGKNTRRLQVSAQEFCHFARVVDLPQWVEADIPQRACTYDSDTLLASPRLMIQGLAFEALYSFDRHIECLLRHEHIEAMGWLETANANHIEGMAEARSVLAALAIAPSQDGEQQP